MSPLKQKKGVNRLSPLEFADVDVESRNPLSDSLEKSPFVL